MTLTWSNLVNHSGISKPGASGSSASPTPGPGAGAGAGSGSGGGGVRPLLTAQADTLPRLSAIIDAMQGDLLGRVLLDRCAEADAAPARARGHA
jgi:hypothetical protein